MTHISTSRLLNKRDLATSFSSWARKKNSASAFLNNSTGTVESSELGPQWTATFKSGAVLSLSAKRLTEDLTEPFELSDDVEVPAGRYSFVNVSGMYQTPYGAALRTGIAFDAGTFYDGHRLSLGLSPGWSVSKHLDLSAEYQYNRVQFPHRGQKFDAHIARMRIKSNVSTQLSSITFIQINTAAHGVVLNVRLRYNPREGNDFYLVYNEGVNINRLRESPALPLTDVRTVLLKYTYTFAL
jgi:hypothetical protein